MFGLDINLEIHHSELLFLLLTQALSRTESFTLRSVSQA